MPFPSIPRSIALALLTVCAMPAIAQERYFVLSMGNATYLGNAQSEADNALASAGQTGIASSITNRSTGYKALLGFKLNPQMAVEGGFVDFGSYNYAATASGGSLGADFRGYGLTASALRLAPVNSELSVFGKAGLTYSVMLGSGGISSREEKLGVAYGVGGLYHLTDKLGLRLEWERVYSDVTLFSVGLQARF